VKIDDRIVCKDFNLWRSNENNAFYTIKLPIHSRTVRSVGGLEVTQCLGSQETGPE